MTVRIQQWLQTFVRKIYPRHTHTSQHPPDTFDNYIKEMGIGFGISGGDKELREELEKEYRKRSAL